jgi:hypothetical protein
MNYEYGASAIITWILFDNIAGGNCRILLNGTTYLNWTSWKNATPQIIPINTTITLGIWNYTIQYCDSVGLWGEPDTVLICVFDNQIPISNTPIDATYSVRSLASIIWVLNDNVAGGYYSILRNGTEYKSWSSWTNGTNLIIQINTSIVGKWNYTILYNDSSGLFGISDTVIINVTSKPSQVTIAGFEFLLGIITFIGVTLRYYSKKNYKTS